jgi:hypothetical protein
VSVFIATGNNTNNAGKDMMANNKAMPPPKAVKPLPAIAEEYTPLSDSIEVRNPEFLLCSSSMRVKKLTSEHCCKELSMFGVKCTFVTPYPRTIVLPMISTITTNLYFDTISANLRIHGTPYKKYRFLLMWW